MERTLAEIAKHVDGKVVGDGKTVISGICGINDAGEGDITFVDNPKYISLIDKTRASAVIAPKSVESSSKPMILADNPSLAFADTMSLFIEEKVHKFTGIHATAVIDGSAKIGANVSVGPNVIIEEKADIGDETIIYGGSYIGSETKIGANCLVYPNVVIRERISIGSNVIIHSGTVIGSDGFGFVNVGGKHRKIPQIGTVVIEDDVEIGSNVSVDRARFDRTSIGRGTKIDNLVQVAHNVIIEENCIIIAQAGISGSCKIEKGAILAGQSGLAGHLTIGAGAIVAAQAGVTKSVPPGITVSGYPAKPHETAIKVNACVQQLPQLVETIRELKKRVESLEAELKKKNK